MNPEQVQAFADARGRELEERYAPAVADAVDKPAALALALTEDGYAASTSEQGLGVQLCQHHCPVQHVAAEFPQLCDAETAALGRLLDVHVQRLATIAHGDGVCTTHVPTAREVVS
jgi:predicted ArsR family transcriptional regulator